MSKNKIKPSILAGFMELIPSDQILFNKMMDTIRKNYERFGFLPIDTPVIEKAEVLLAKGGGETEQQIYRFKKGDTDLALRFDLTVPLARYVAQHFSELTFPFRRYHIGKVYRGEKAQRGRFREFYQCDIDIIGNGSLDVINDAEIPSVIYSTFKDLGFDSFVIKINNRKVLNGFFKWLEIDKPLAILRAIDKIEKIGAEGVIKELENIGLEVNTIEKIMEFIGIEGTNEEKLSSLERLNINNEIFNEGVEELKLVNHYVGLFGVPRENYSIDLTIARGLDYYTGTVYETFLKDYPEIGSICSGGRYDNLAEYYTDQKLPGVGISIGLTRLFYQLSEAKLIKSEDSSLTKAIILPMENCLDRAVEIANILRNNKVNTQIYLEKAKMGKKFGFADKLNIPYAIIIGEEEIKENKYTFRNMKTGEQAMLSIEEILFNLNIKF
ncbi:histidine--tRNA ligase [Tepidimicrobium xylanilyticum]|uniref:Histidine--tRNA ligase n=1 Tax=Tepidimicrobium xylanilyticum TaxID=1123352 RepID=A0A1H3BG48_9FIRM|nr:histidine--tRNA ligase [Tepidimicrobium xylanilyticum]GMG96915.1 histidine--tRNA ligase [Tepidimicrobium xylanilyticum]SDX40671.1 histidyl-tRNA synthetase [Tepidimicrobium xylanilyticum]